MADLSCIPTLTPEHEAALRKLDIRSTDSLLFGVNSVQDLRLLSARSGIDEATLIQFVQFSEIMRLPGVGNALGRNLFYSGLHSISAIARMQPTELVRHMHLTRDVAISGRKSDQIVTAARAMRQRFSGNNAEIVPQTSPVVLASALASGLPVARMLGDE